MAKTKGTVALHKKLQEKKEELEKLINVKYQAGETFRPNTYSQRGVVDIRSANKHQLKAVMKELLREKEAMEQFGEKVSRINGFTIEEWKHDLKLRWSILNRNEKLREIAVLETQVEDIMNNSEKKEIKLGELNDLIGSL